MHALAGEPLSKDGLLKENGQIDWDTHIGRYVVCKKNNTVTHRRTGFSTAIPYSLEGFTVEDNHTDNVPWLRKKLQQWGTFKMRACD